MERQEDGHWNVATSLGNEAIGWADGFADCWVLVELIIFLLALKPQREEERDEEEEGDITPSSTPPTAQQTSGRASSSMVGLQGWLSHASTTRVNSIVLPR